MPTCPHPTCPCAHKNITAEALLNHVQSTPWAALYVCTTCKCVCKSEAVLTHHKQKVHGVPPVHSIGLAMVPAVVPIQPSRPSSSAAYSCRVCNKLYGTTSALEQHYRDTPVHPKCTRSGCNLGFVDNSAMQAHVVSVHRPTVAPAAKIAPVKAPAAFSCRICDRAYTTTSALELHYRDTPVHPKCTRCDIGFVDSAAMQTHVVSVHRPITCYICSMQVYEEDLDHHYKTSPMHALCTVCDVGFEDKEALNQHTDASHPGFRCRTCNVPFGSKALLVAHYQESPRHPSCPECKLSFEDNLSLIQHVIEIFNPLIKDSGRLILKTSQMSSHDSFSNASIISRASRRSSIARSPSPPSIGAITPTRSLASPVSSVRRQLSTPPPPPRSPEVDSDPDRSIYSPRLLHNRTSTINSQSLNSRAPSVSEHVILLDVFEEHDSEHNMESTRTNGTAASGRSTPSSAAASITTRSLVAGAPYRSETASPVSSARSIFGRVPSVTSTSRAQDAGLRSVFPARESPVQTAFHHALSFQSNSTDTRTNGSPGSVTSSIKTVSPPPSHVVFPSPGQRDRFRISPRADSLPKSQESERFHSPKPESLRLFSDTENIVTAESNRNGKLFTPPTPTVVATYPSAEPQTELAPGEKLVSYVYCRICRRDPCRQPAATMCGHVFCYQCISSEVVKTTRCPVCEAPTLLYSIFKLHLV